MNDVHAKIERLAGTVDAAQSVLGKVERVLTAADEVHERSRRFVAGVTLLLAVGAAVVVGRAVVRRRSP